jgi:gliding motility-associated-like protein
MTHAWVPFGGQLTPVENWNMVITATQTNTFVRVTESQTKACVDTATVLVPVGIPPDLAATVTPTAICPGQSAQITLTVNPAGQAIEWDDPTGSLSCTDCLTPIASPAGTTTYSVTTPGADCPGSTSITVVVLPLPALNLAPQTLCLGSSTVLNNIPVNPADTYTWSVVPPGDPASLSNPGVSNPTVTPTTTTTYSVQASGQCFNQGTVIVTVNSATITVSPDQTVCFGTPATLTATVNASPGATGTISWVPGPGTGPTLTVTPAVTTTYTAVYTFQPNCTVLDSSTVTVLPGIILSEITTDTIRDIICEGTVIPLLVDVAPPGVSLVWFQNGVPVPGATADSISVIPPGDTEPVTVSYTVVATDANGCSATAGPFEQLVRRCIVFPNAFTPDGDGNNDTFGGLVTFGGEGNIEVLEFRVFNRWGGQVFESTNTKKVWDGRVGGKDAPSDVYVYYISVRFANGEEKTYKGDVSLLR